jgi:hypothetical protein
MNRRRFFTKFGLLASAASMSPTIFIPKFEPVRWKRGWSFQSCDFTFSYIDMAGVWDLRMVKARMKSDEPFWAVKIVVDQSSVKP